MNIQKFKFHFNTISILILKNIYFSADTLQEFVLMALLTDWVCKSHNFSLIIFIDNQRKFINESIFNVKYV